LFKLGPDAKSQVSLEYINGKPVRATSVVVSTQHDASVSQEEVREMVRPHVENILPPGWMCAEKDFYVNPTGRFVIGGPDGDCGLTGRKIIVDTYGGAAPHGGGAFSGKDPRRWTVRRPTPRVMPRRISSPRVWRRNARFSCPTRSGFLPHSIYVNTYGTGRYGDDAIARAIQEIADFRPRGIRERLGLNRPILPAPPPTATSAARRMPMAGSAGKNRIWSRR